MGEFEQIARLRAQLADSEDSGSKTGVDAPKRALLEYREYKVDLDSKLGKTQVVTKTTPLAQQTTPTVAAPAPMNLAAESMSLRATEVDRAAVCWLTGAAEGWTHMADEAGLQARAFLEQLVMT